MKKTFSRRDILKFGAAAVSASALGKIGFVRVARAAAPYVTGYKALVCVYLSGGNNGFNLLVPTSNAGYATYQASRSTLALAQGSLLPIAGTASDGYTYGLHPSCTALQTLFGAGHAAFVGNVGTLIEPTTPAQARGGGSMVPPQLFSHGDQSTQWMTSLPQSLNRFGWAGRIADLFASKAVPAPFACNIDIANSSANYWQAGQATLPYVLGTGGAPSVAALGNDGLRMRSQQDLLTQAAADPNPFVSEYAKILTNADTKVATVSTALTTAGDLTTPFPSNNGDGGQSGDSGLDAQLHEVARVIKAASLLGDARHMFYVQINGFDTHSGELATQARLLQYVSDYLNTFFTAMGEIGMQQNVVAFTMSDFGRTLSTNSDGSDHGWGSHHVVVGGPVKAGLYGTMPNLALDGPDDFGSGRIVPTTSTDQYAATLASWFGVADEDLPTVFPNLANFTTKKLGFL